MNANKGNMTIGELRQRLEHRDPAETIDMVLYRPDDEQPPGAFDNPEDPIGSWHEGKLEWCNEEPYEPHHAAFRLSGTATTGQEHMVLMRYPFTFLRLHDVLTELVVRAHHEAGISEKAFAEELARYAIMALERGDKRSQPSFELVATRGDYAVEWKDGVLTVRHEPKKK